jgi:DNA repair protein RAD50
MSKIDKLTVMGVRSFDNQHAERITFFHPLTLIVGLNGSGKTTIIECLRYATTGELPPNSGSQGAWIHDPKLCGEKEVMASVTLQFESTKKTKMVVNRKLQLTVKKSVRSQKFLEGSLLTHNHGERTVISTRMAELDQMMPEYLGVSKAILESVIFCHQDESLWPMSQPAILKKRFDEIFEAMKYTKAIDNIKVLRKKQKEELDKLKIIEQHAKEDKDKGARNEKRSEELYNGIEALRVRNNELQEHLNEAQEKSREAWEHAARFDKIVTELGGKRIEAQANEKSIQKLKQHMKEMTDSDEELQSMQDKYEERVNLYQAESEKYRKQYQDFAQELDENRSTLGIRQSELGRFEAEKDRYEHQLEARRTLIKETARSHNIRGFDADISDTKVRDFMERIGRMAREHNTTLERIRRETQDETRKAQQALNVLNERRSAYNQSKEGARTQISVNDQKIVTLQSHLDSIEIDEGGKAVLESTIKDTEHRLANAKTELDSANWDNRIQITESQLKSLDEQKERLDAELIEATRQASESARIDFLRKELRDRQQSLNTMSGAHGSRISEIVGNEWEPSSLDRAYKMTLDSHSSAVKDAELQRDGTNRELEQVQFMITTASNDLSVRHQELRDHEKKIYDATGDDPQSYTTRWEELEEEYERVHKDTTSWTIMENHYKGCLKQAKEKGICQLCQRPLKSEEKSTFFTRLEDKIRKATQELASEAYAEFEAEYNQYKAVHKDHDAYVRLKAEIPSLESNRKELDTKRDGLVRKLEQQDELVKEKEDAKRDVESLNKTVLQISKYYAEVTNFTQQIQTLEESQKASGLSRGLEKIQQDLKGLNDQTRSANSNLTQLRIDKDRSRTLVNTLEIEVRDLRSKLSTAVHQLKEKSNLEAQMEDIKRQNQHHREAVRQTDQDIQALVPQISQAQAKLDDISQRGEERSAELQQETSKLNGSLNQLKQADEEINTYIDRGGPQQLSRATREIARLGGEIDRIEKDQRNITIEIKRIEDQLRNHAETKRAITDNLTYRENVRDLERLKLEIGELEAHNAEADKDRYEREGQKWQTERNRLAAEQATVIGSLKSKDDQLTELITDWEAEYKDAPTKYKEAHVRVETTKAAVEDLGRYGSALDKAIMKYHSLKMEEINRIVEELWRKTYQGTDVDTICIRSDYETQKSNKSYNYRVVMIKQDAEMDMRGRCSAGQKVLASIIIRLALAECFGVNCGLIALDEPTTNLDRDNIRALAEALAEIIKIRRQQKNFQLLVITHDLEFLRYMKCDEFADEFYRVSRDEKQKSKIEKQNVTEVM